MNRGEQPAGIVRRILLRGRDTIRVVHIRSTGQSQLHFAQVCPRLAVKKFVIVAHARIIDLIRHHDEAAPVIPRAAGRAAIDKNTFGIRIENAAVAELRQVAAVCVVGVNAGAPIFIGDVERLRQVVTEHGFQAGQRHKAAQVCAGHGIEPVHDIVIGCVQPLFACCPGQQGQIRLAAEALWRGDRLHMRQTRQVEDADAIGADHADVQQVPVLVNDDAVGISAQARMSERGLFSAGRVEGIAPDFDQLRRLGRDEHQRVAERGRFPECDGVHIGPCAIHRKINTQRDRFKRREGRRFSRV